MISLEEYWEAVSQRVCSKCIDGDRHGNCRLKGDECGLRMHFPRIVSTVLSVSGSEMQAYVDALRQNVCTFCNHQAPDGSCLFRANVDCGLDRYFPLVVEAIEELPAAVSGSNGLHG